MGDILFKNRLQPLKNEVDLNILSMKPEDKELAEQVIVFFKESDNVMLSPSNHLPHLLPNNNKSKRVIDSLEKNFGLIEKCGEKNKSFRLTSKGWKFTTFEKLEKDSKKTPLNTYQKIYIALFIIFGLSTMVFGFLNYTSNRQNDVLKFQVDSLKTQSQIYKDSVELLKQQTKLYIKQSIDDSLQTKNYPDAKVD